MQIFISYSHQDQAFAGRLAELLEEAGYKVWVDKKDITGGEKWRKKIRKGIANSNIFLLIASNASHNSIEVHNEVKIAFDRNITLVPVLIEGERWPEHSETQHIDMRLRQPKELPDHLPEDLLRALKANPRRLRRSIIAFVIVVSVVLVGMIVYLVLKPRDGNQPKMTIFDFEDCPKSEVWYWDQSIGTVGPKPSCSRDKVRGGDYALRLTLDFPGNEPSGEEAAAVYYQVPEDTVIDWRNKSAFSLQLYSPENTPSTCGAQFFVKFKRNGGYVFANHVGKSLVPGTWMELTADFDQFMDEHHQNIDLDLTQLYILGLKIYCNPSSVPLSGTFFIDDVGLK